MVADPIRTLANFASALASAPSLRDGCTAALEVLASSLQASFAIIARPAQDRGVADLVGSTGLHAADFRRLEARLPNSSLWRILGAATPFVIDDLGQDPVLSFAAYGTHSQTVYAVPITSASPAAALIAVGFASGAQPEEGRTLRLLDAAAAIVGHSVKVQEAVVSDNERLAAENRRLKLELRERYDFGNLIGNSGAMRQALDQVKQIARSNATVLLHGEPGTGKDTFANVIRFNSLRSKRPFVKLDLTATSDSQQPNELAARLTEAATGTLFLDEIAAASLELQRLVLDLVRSSKRATRDYPAEHNVRIIAAGSGDIESAVAEGKFDAELQDELGSFSIFLPPLRERKSDILLLADHFLERYAAAQKKSILRISTPAIDMLTAYHFPGNVRELENVIEHAVASCDSNVIHGHHLPPTLQTAEITGTETRVTLDAAVATFERDLIQDALKSTRGNVAKAARMLDSTERILGYKIKKYDLDPRRFKSWR